MSDPYHAAGLSQQQLQAHWMAFTGNRDFKQHPRMVVAANGRYYQAADGRQIFDGLSGLWCCGAGHNRREINEAVSRQLGTLDYAPGFQFGQPLSFELANRLVELTPQGLDQVFFTNSGSDAVDTALKMARAYWRHKGQAHKTRLIGRARSYHGVNFGGISVGGIGPNRKPYGQTLEADHLPHTVLPENAFSRGLPQQGAYLADELLNLIALHDASTIAAVIVEPLAGSGGVLPPPQGYLPRLRELCTQHNILLIFDEVITGFGRLGATTAAEAFQVTPDIMTIAKQVTNGAIPLGAVLAGGDIYDTFMAAGGPDYLVEFPHGYTYSAHPVACAAALAALHILQNDDLIHRVQAMAPVLENAVHSLKGTKYVTDIRNYGLAAALSIESLPGEPAKRPWQIAMACWEKGFYVRYGGDAIQLAPPFTVESEEIDNLINVIGEAIQGLPA